MTRKVRYHRDGTVTVSDNPSKIVARWRKVEDGFEVLLISGITLHVWPRKMADAFVLDDEFGEGPVQIKR
jgi:hypothetical protein